MIKRLRIWFSSLPYFYILGFLVLAYLLFLVGRGVYINFKINQEIKNLKTSIANLEEENKNLQNLITYYQTPSFKEKEARKKLGLVKPDEKVVIITKSPTPAPKTKEKTAEGKIKKPNWELWWEYLFGEGKR